MSILIEKTGVLDTFQDLGRFGSRKEGINPNGAMDKTALRLINILLGNSETEAALEMHFPASEIKFEKQTLFAIGGADFTAKLNKSPIDNWQIHLAKKNDLLKFKNKHFGNRCYLAIDGGYKLDEWLGSSSTNLNAEIGGLEGRKLKKGDRIDFNNTQRSNNSIPKIKIARSIIPKYSNFPTVRIVKGSEYNDLTALSEQNFLSQSFKVSANSNRMGYRLEGTELHLLEKKELISSAVDFGTIQLLPDGQLIILMADHQTTGGYPKIANVIEKDLPLVAQLGAGDGIGFHLVSIEEAENLKLKFEKDLSFLKIGLKLS